MQLLELCNYIQILVFEDGQIRSGKRLDSYHYKIYSMHLKIFLIETGISCQLYLKQSWLDFIVLFYSLFFSSFKYHANRRGAQLFLV